MFYVSSGFILVRSICEYLKVITLQNNVGISKVIKTDGCRLMCRIHSFSSNSIGSKKLILDERGVVLYDLSHLRHDISLEVSNILYFTKLKL